ncbi:MAG: NTPase, partial [Desulfotalea sp.]
FCEWALLISYCNKKCNRKSALDYEFVPKTGMTDNLRDVYRFTSTLSFYFSLLSGKTAFEVNPVDLIAIECLRIFEPEVYGEIVRSKYLFTNNGGERNETTTALVNGILDKASEGKRDSVEGIVRQLFPAIDSILGGRRCGNGFGNGWLRDMRICHHSNFDKYFKFGVYNGELSNSDFKVMLALTGDSTKLSEFLMSLMERDMLANALSQFGSFTDSIPIENANTYIKALLDIGDKIDHENVWLTKLSSNGNARKLVLLFLQRIENSKTRGELLLKCFQDSEGISIVGSILHISESTRENNKTDIVFQDKEFEESKDEFVSKLDSMAKHTPDKLITHAHLVSFLYDWKRWGDEVEIIDWLKDQTDNAEGCVNFLKGFVHKSPSQTIGSHVIKITNSINLESIEKYLSVADIIYIIKSATKTEYDSKGQDAIDAFNDALDRREKGIVEEW